jgi:RNA polymerase sigma factor (sigma-70 family)
MNAFRSFDVIGLLEPLRRYARALTRNDNQAEDLVQNTLLRAYERQGTFKPEASLKNWLFAIQHNLFIDECRRQQAEKWHTATVVDLSIGSQVPNQESHIRLQQIEQLFNLLPEDQKAVLHLIAVEGQTYQEAADCLGIPIGTLMSRLGRARAALREQEDGARRSKSSPRPALRTIGETDG